MVNLVIHSWILAATLAAADSTAPEEHLRSTVIGLSASVNPETHEAFSYDLVGNLLSASNETAYLSFGYDAMDRLTSAATSLSNATYNVTYRRDAGGLVTNLVYASGKTLTRTYDPDGRLASVSDWLGHT